MNIGSLMTRTVGVGLLLLSGCDVARSARDDLFGRPNPPPASSQARRTAPATSPGAATASRAQPAATVRGSAAAPVQASAAATPADGGPARAPSGSPQISLTGKTEAELRALLGAPTSEETHPPGKQWRYRDGKCTLDIQLYPDVETKQFGTLAYKVRSDDDTDEGKRLCIARVQSRLAAGG